VQVLLTPNCRSIEPGNFSVSRKTTILYYLRLTPTEKVNCYAKLYGISGSRALRSIWAIEEVGVEYEQVPTNFTADSKAADYLTINPNGRIPALIDGDLVLFEPMAIKLYLAKTYGGALYPDNAADEVRVNQWSVWGISEIEPLQMQIVVQKLFIPEDK
jgi:glutathione S-transferase